MSVIESIYISIFTGSLKRRTLCLQFYPFKNSFLQQKKAQFKKKKLHQNQAVNNHKEAFSMLIASSCDCVLLFQASLEAQKRRLEIEKNRVTHSANGDAPRPAQGPRISKGGGWLPSSTSQSASELDDPLLQQINNIESFLQQARAANRTDEAAMLEDNLRQLQEEFDAQQMSQAIEMSQRQAQEEDLQRSQILHLQQMELESKTNRLDLSGLGDSKNIKEHMGTWEKEGESGWGDLETSPQSNALSINSFPRLPGNSPPLQRDECTTFPPGGEASLNPFDDDDATPVEDDSSNPFSEEIQREQQQKAVRKPKEYNPFEEGQDEEQDVDARKNPFGDDVEHEDKGNPFKETSGKTPSAPTNPFEDDDDDGPALEDIIEEELLLQQIDNIRAYIFDAKLSGRTDEVELLSQNLRELQCTLQEQKRKAH